MSAPKKYAIISFNNSTVEVIPSSWLLSDSEAKWPDSVSENQIANFIRKCKTPESDWETLKVKIFCYAKSFASANKKANIAMETSNIGSDSSESEDASKKRKKKRPLRYLSESSSEEENEYYKKKKFNVPCVPSPKVFLTSSPNENDVLESATSCSDSNSESLLAPRTNYTELKKSPHLQIISSINSPSNSGIVFKRAKNCLNSNSETSIMPRIDSHSQVLLTRILQGITKLEQGQKRLETMVNELNHKVTSQNTNLNQPALSFVLPQNFQLPITTNLELINFNIKLSEDKDFQIHMIRYLQLNCCGKTLSSFLTSILKKLVVKEVAIMYSRLGRKGVASLKFKGVEIDDVSEKFGRVLASAADWDRLKLKLPSDPSSLQFSE